MNTFTSKNILKTLIQRKIPDFNKTFINVPDMRHIDFWGIKCIFCHVDQQ